MRLRRPSYRDREPPQVWERHPGCAAAPLERTWQRRRPERTALWQIVAAELPGFIDRLAVEHGRSLPPHVERELLGYLDCGILDRGFARARCKACHHEIFVAFSCKGRSLCPSCTARRMTDLAAHLVDRVVPFLPMRQWVLTYPKRIRWHLAHDPRLAAQALGIAIDVLFGWQRRLARQHGVDFGAPARSQRARGAAIAFWQRFSSSLELAPHLHALLPDGVFARASADPEARPRFHRLPPPTDDDVHTLLRRIARRTVALLQRRGRLDEQVDLDDTQAVFELGATRSVRAGPFEPAPLPDLCARLAGFSLHAARAVHENDRQGLEQLARYCARPALSLQRLSILDDGRIRYQMKRVFSDGRSEVVLSPHEFLSRLCALVAPPRVHLVRYFGAFARRARGRAALTGQLPRPAPAAPQSSPAPTVRKPAGPTPPTPPPSLCASPRAPDPRSPPSPTPPALGQPPPDPLRPRRLDWASLLKRVHAIDVLRCAACGGTMLVLAYLTHAPTVRHILDHLNIPPVVRPRPVARRLCLPLDSGPAEAAEPPPAYDAVDPPPPPD
jgi:hypothetical protein